MSAMGRYTASRIAEVAQLVEHRSEKPGVDSSILSLGTTKPELFAAHQGESEYDRVVLGAAFPGK
jgi:hypothetical protein